LVSAFVVWPSSRSSAPPSGLGACRRSPTCGRAPLTNAAAPPCLEPANATPRPISNTTRSESSSNRAASCAIYRRARRRWASRSSIPTPKRGNAARGERHRNPMGLVRRVREARAVLRHSQELATAVRDGDRVAVPASHRTKRGAPREVSGSGRCRRRVETHTRAGPGISEFAATAPPADRQRRRRSDNHWPIRRAVMSDPRRARTARSHAPAASDRLAPSRSAIRPAARRRPLPDAKIVYGEVSF
jgi:hypothetical protein